MQFCILLSWHLPCLSAAYIAFRKSQYAFLLPTRCALCLLVCLRLIYFQLDSLATSWLTHLLTWLHAQCRANAVSGAFTRSQRHSLSRWSTHRRPPSFTDALPAALTHSLIHLVPLRRANQLTSRLNHFLSPKFL